MVIGWGNLGAPPQPPRRASKVASREATACSRTLRSIEPPSAAERWPTKASTSLVPEASTSVRSSRHALRTPARTSRNEGMPWRGSFGK